MTTPTKLEIYEKALELYVEHCYRSGNPKLADLTPEYNELTESGFVQTARSELMTNLERKHQEWLHNEDDLMAKSFMVDLKEGLKSGIFVSGGKQTGKTNLVKKIANEYIKFGCIVKVFDVSRAWLKSSLPYYQTINTKNLLLDFDSSVVYDLSTLYSEQIKQFIAKVIDIEFRHQVQTPEDKRKWRVYIFEEGQILVPANRLRSTEAQAVLRLMTVGANYKIAYVLITQRPVTVDTTALELCYQKYFGRCDGDNDLKKIRNWVGKENLKELPNLKLGQFIYDMGSTTEKIETDLFKPTQIPKPLIINPENPKPQQPQTESIKALTTLLTLLGLAFAIGVWLG